MKRFLATASAIALLLSTVSVPAVVVAQAPAAASTLFYSSIIKDSDGNPITVPLTFRFSIWTSSDYVDSDRDGAAINEAAPNYADWSEVQSLTPAVNGFVIAFVGTVNDLPLLDASVHRFMQVEVKGALQADEFYRLIDISGDSGADAIDRRPLFTYAYAQNARMVDGRVPGTGSGDLLLLSPNGVVSDAQMGSGTNADAFTINADGTGDTSLVFGDSILPATLTFSQAHDRFEFSTSVYIDGDLTVTGSINGIPVEALEAAGGLAVAGESGLSVSVAAGTYRLNGDLVQYAGTSGVSVPNNAIAAVYFDTDGLQVSVDGFPAAAHIPLAQVRTVGGSIVSVLDVRALQSDDREVQGHMALHPPFDGASNKGDGTGNVGMLYVDFDDVAQRNFYLWTSTQSSLQDYQINVPITLPPTFLRWRDEPIVVQYRSTTASAADNRLDISMTDTAGQAVTLTGGTAALAATTWTESGLGFSASPTWTPGGTAMLRFTVSAKDSKEIHLGLIQLHFDVLQDN